MKRAGIESISVVIPAFNEAENLDLVLTDCMAVLQPMTEDFEIVVVDDCSTDATPEIARSWSLRDSRVKVIPNPECSGCHPSEVLGFEAAVGDAEFFIPGDRQILPDQLPRCLEALSQADLVLTFRERRADPRARILMARAYNWLVRALFGLPARDIDSSILIRRGVLEDVLPLIDRRSGFIPVELVFHAVHRSWRVTEVPIEHHPRVAGSSSGMSVPEAVRTLRRLLAFRLRLGRRGRPRSRARR